MDENIKTIYRIPAPGCGEIEVYGDPSMIWYEWRLVIDGEIEQDSAGMQYGDAAVALRDALMYATGMEIHQ